MGARLPKKSAVIFLDKSAEIQNQQASAIFYNLVRSIHIGMPDK
jgi:hypothetical protein